MDHFFTSSSFRRGWSAISIHAYVNISLRDARGGGLRRERHRPLRCMCVKRISVDGAPGTSRPPWDWGIRVQHVELQYYCRGNPFEWHAVATSVLFWWTEPPLVFTQFDLRNPSRSDFSRRWKMSWSISELAPFLQFPHFYLRLKTRKISSFAFPKIAHSVHSPYHIGRHPRLEDGRTDGCARSQLERA